MSIVAREIVKPFNDFARRPGFAIAVLVILALGIGANTATLNLLYGYLLAPLPYPGSEDLVEVYFISNQMPGDLQMSYPTYFDLRAQTTGMSDAAMFEAESLNLIWSGRAVHARGAVVSASLFTTLAMHPQLGRVFEKGANEPGAPREVILSYRLWSRLFNRSPAVLGRVVKLNDVTYTVIGVMPETFQFPDPETDVWLPKVIDAFDHAPSNLTAWHDTMVARLAPGVSPHQLVAQSQAVLERELAHFPNPTAIPQLKKLGMRIAVRPLRNALIGDLGERLVLAQLATGLLLLLVWFNLANLFITRALTRRGELIVRRVLGAETPVLFRQLLGESLVPCLLGGVAGLLLGRPLLRVLLGSGFGSTALAFPSRNWAISVGIALLLALVSALVFSLAGLYLIRRQDLAQALRETDARSVQSRSERRVRAALVTIQLALASTLFGAGAMLTRSLLNLNSVRLGFQPEHVLTFQIHFPTGSDSPAQPDLEARLDALYRAVTQVPGVEAATVSGDVPFDGQASVAEAYPHPFDSLHTPSVYPIVADFGYFRTFGIHLLAGRAPVPEESTSGPGDAVIDVKAAQDLFGTRDVVGREFNFDNPNDSRHGLLFRVVGIVDYATTIRLTGGDSTGVVYVNRRQTVDPSRPAWSWAGPTWYVAVRTPLGPAGILPSLRRAVSRTLPGVPVYDVRSMNDRLSGQLAPRRSLTALVFMFALGAVVVAAVGLYAVQSYTVSQRRVELGMRAVLGADARRLRALLLRETIVLLAVGLSLGICGMVVLGRVFSAAFYDLRAADPPSLALVLVILSMTAVLAGWIPARSAGRVAPMEALRDR